MKLGKQLIIEKVLNTKINMNQLKAIKNGFYAFYESPQDYENTIVVELVKQFILEIQ